MVVLLFMIQPMLVLKFRVTLQERMQEQIRLFRVILIMLI